MAARAGMNEFPAKEDDWSIAARIKPGRRQAKPATARFYPATATLSSARKSRLSAKALQFI
jgi:hypothetical protein